MKPKLILFICSLILLSGSGSAQSYPKSTLPDQIIRLITNYHVLVDYSEHLENRLSSCEELNKRVISERNALNELLVSVKQENAEMHLKNAKLERKVKRNRKIALFLGGGLIITIFVLS
jgi:hypothetical protein